MIKGQEEEELDIEDIDKEDMAKCFKEFPLQIRDAFKVSTSLSKSIDSIFIVGMGGSAFGGDLLRAYLSKLSIPIYSVRDYSLPEFVTRNSLVFVVSYSGNTEETINAYRMAIRKDAQIITMSAGGKLEKLASRQDTLHINIPFRDIQPRMSYCFQFFAMLKVLENSGILKDLKPEVEKTIMNMNKPMFKEMAQELAQKLEGKVPIIYSSNTLKPLAYKWKINFNENTKIHAFCNVFPEMNHNEMLGYTDLKAGYYVIILKDEDDYHRIKKRMDITKKLIQQRGVNVTEIGLKGHTLLTRMFTALYVGDWTSYYLAIKHKTDPTPVDLVEEFKGLMG